jgi:hypothetical protein
VMPHRTSVEDTTDWKSVVRFGFRALAKRLAHAQVSSSQIAIAPFGRLRQYSRMSGNLRGSFVVGFVTNVRTWRRASIGIAVAFTKLDPFLKSSASGQSVTRSGRTRAAVCVTRKHGSSRVTASGSAPFRRHPQPVADKPARDTVQPTRSTVASHRRSEFARKQARRPAECRESIPDRDRPFPYLVPRDAPAVIPFPPTDSFPKQFDFGPFRTR